MHELDICPRSTKKLLEEKVRRDADLLVHPALELSKFPAWRWNERKESYESDVREAYKWGLQAVSRLQQLVEKWQRRRRAWLDQLGPDVEVVVVEARTPCVLWLAAPTPLELGFCLHHTYGVPYLPGSGLKGLARAAMIREVQGVPLVDTGKTLEQHTRGANETSESVPAEVEALFGKGGDDGWAGKVDFLDGIPLQADCLEMEVMSPHHPKYYQGESQDPHDCEDPIPLPFLRIRPGSEFEIAIVARAGAGERHSADLQEAKKYLLLGLENLGLGAKTSSGYGLFAPASARQARGATPPGEAPRVTAPAGTSEAGSRRITGVVVASFDLQADRLVFQAPDNSTYEASIKFCAQRFGVNARGLNELRRNKTPFDIDVQDGRVVAVYRKGRA